MARIRTIKPGFFTNEEVAEMNPLHRLLFIGLWCIADRSGRLEDRPKRIKAELLPYDTVNIDAALSTIAQYGFITRYEVDEKKYIQINNFEKHQHCHIKEPDSTIPAPCKTGVETVLARQEGKGREQEGNIVDGAIAKAKAPKLTDEEWLESLKSNPAYEGLDVVSIYGKLIAWCELKGKKPTRARLLNWLNREERPMHGNNGNGNGKKPMTDEELTDLKAKLRSFYDQKNRKQSMIAVLQEQNDDRLPEHQKDLKRLEWHIDKIEMKLGIKQEITA